MSLTSTNGETAVILASCTCPIGLSGACGHVTGMLYQLASYKNLGQKAFPEDVASTSLPQTWHTPRGLKISGKAVQDLTVSGYSKTTMPETTPKAVKSTLYNPLRGDPIDWHAKHDFLAKTAPEFLVLSAIKDKPTMTMSKFGPVPYGSLLSYQQKLDDDFIMNIYDGIGFPDLPIKNVMENNLYIVLNEEQSVKLEGIKLSIFDIHRFEKLTRLQSQSSLWYKVRKHRVTASNIGNIFKRRKNEDTLVKRLQSTRHVTTAAMRQGIASEPRAAKHYAEVNNNQVNLYPCGVIVSPVSPWIAASPDRKVYNPNRYPTFGLLEIKCPQVASVLECPYLSKDEAGNLKLKRNHNYYYQVLTQLAVTGLDWCDFFVWCVNDHHQETIYLNTDLWNEIKHKIDQFYFNHFI